MRDTPITVGRAAVPGDREMGESVMRWAAAVDGFTEWMVAAGRTRGTVETI